MLAMILTALAPLTVIGACVGAGIAAIAAVTVWHVLWWRWAVRSWRTSSANRAAAR